MTAPDSALPHSTIPATSNQAAPQRRAQAATSRPLGSGTSINASNPAIDLVCVSHLRWKFVVQRPQHLLRRFAQERRVLFIEEPVFRGTRDEFHLEAVDGITLAVPHLAEGHHPQHPEERLRPLVDDLLKRQHIHDFALWYYTPMALGFTSHLRPKVVVWDCMDELSAFAFAPRELLEREAELLRRADVVFTGGVSLYEAKRHRHHNIHPFPSSIDTAHFAKARSLRVDPEDQAPIPRTRIGFCGVIDERFDIDLLRESATLRPDWNWIMIGPVVKIDPASLPRLPNIHYLGKKDYAQLPTYLGGWDAAILPFARNESTRYISPTKTPEYLAAGCPVVSTSIRDVVQPYGEQGLVHIADDPRDFVAGLELAMKQKSPRWQQHVDRFLAQSSWDQTHRDMDHLIQQAIHRRASAQETAKPLPV